MAVSVKVGAFDVSTAAAGNTQAITGVGFLPKFILFWWSGIVSSVDAISGGNHQRGFGAAISATERRSTSSQSQDASASAVSDHGQELDECIFTITTAGGIDGLMDLQSMDSDGFTLIIDDQFAGAVRIHYMAFGGSDLTNYVLGHFSMPQALGNADVITGLSFRPDFVLFFGGKRNVDVDSISPDSQNMLGFAVSSTKQGCWTGGSNNASTTMQTMSYCFDGECFATMNTGVVALTDRFSFVQFNADGVKVNVLDFSADVNRVHYLAVKGGLWTVGDLLTQVDTVTDIVESGFGFSPRCAFFVSHGKAKSTQNTPTDHDRYSCGAFSSLTDRGSHGILDQDAVADSVVTRAVEHDELYVNISTAEAIDGLMDIKSIDSDGFTCIMDDADPSQAFVTYFAVGDSPPSAGQPTMRRWIHVPGMQSVLPRLGRAG